VSNMGSFVFQFTRIKCGGIGRLVNACGNTCLLQDNKIITVGLRLGVNGRGLRISL
jgi:hypothetical protein